MKENIAQSAFLQEITRKMIIRELNSLGLEPYNSMPVSPFAKQVNAHQDIHEQHHLAIENNPTEPVETHQILAHNLINSQQINNHVSDCGFWEQLPEPTLQEVLNDILPIFPDLPGLKLVNADRALNDGYLVYVGSRTDCVIAAQEFSGSSVKRNSKDGRSWKLIIIPERLSYTTPKFNYKSYAQDAVATYKQQTSRKTTAA